MRAEKDELVEQFKSPGAADGDDILAVRDEMQGKLDRSEAHRHEVSRKLGKERKHQQARRDSRPLPT